jgi:hypothetical protein
MVVAWNDVKLGTLRHIKNLWNRKKLKSIPKTVQRTSFRGKYDSYAVMNLLQTTAKLSYGTPKFKNVVTMF